MAIQPQHLHQLRNLSMIPRRPHPMTPRNSLILPLRPNLPLPIQARLRRHPTQFLVARLRPLGRRQWRTRRQNRILRSSTSSTSSNNRLKQKLAADLLPVPALERGAVGHLLDALQDALEARLEDARLHVRGRGAERQRADHAELRVELARGVGVDGEGGVGDGGVPVDEGGVAAADDGDEGGEGEGEEGGRGDGFGEGGDVLLAVLYMEH